ncbi:MAG: SpoIIE family protein phosphatase [Bryobacter sp.]|nr:SpoIIE family protein phosphatase [Bryobacter sp. CoA8 C33]
MPFELTVINPSGNSLQVPLDHFPFSIGRHNDNQLILRDSRVSRKHALIETQDSELRIRDLESLHGVRVNGVKIHGAQRLAAGDTVDFGLEDGYRLVLVEKSDAELRRLMGKLPGARGADSELSKLRALTEVARSLEHAMSTHDVLAAVVEAALTVTGCERGFLLLEQTDQLVVELGRDNTGRVLDNTQLPIPADLIRRALKERKELLSFQLDPLADWSSRFNASAGVRDLRRVLCVPLLRLRGGVNTGETMAATVEDTVGLIYMDSRHGEAVHEEGNRELLQTLALEASTILENARLLEEERKKHRLEQELALARTIQSNLLPHKLAAEGPVAAVGSSIPTHQVGGDFYDVLRRPDGSWLVAVADVSGKGVGAALLASLLQGVLLEAASSGAQLDQWLPRLNRFLLERTAGEKYATIFACNIDAGGRLEYINAGHSRPFIVRPNHAGGPTLEALDQDGFPVGLLDIATFEPAPAQLHPGDTLVLFSDGVEEGRRGPNEFFGRERIAAALMARAQGSVQEIHDHLRDSLTSYLAGVEPHDDATLLLVRYLP